MDAYKLTPQNDASCLSLWIDMYFSGLRFIYCQEQPSVQCWPTRRDNFTTEASFSISVINCQSMAAITTA